MLSMLFEKNVTGLHSNDGSDFVSSLISVSSFLDVASTTSPPLTTHASTVTGANVTLSVPPQTFTHASSDHPPNQTLSSHVPTGNVFNFRARGPLQCCPQQVERVCCAVFLRDDDISGPLPLQLPMRLQPPQRPRRPLRP